MHWYCQEAQAGRVQSASRVRFSLCELACLMQRCVDHLPGMRDRESALTSGSLSWMDGQHHDWKWAGNVAEGVAQGGREVALGSVRGRNAGVR